MLGVARTGGRPGATPPSGRDARGGRSRRPEGRPRRRPPGPRPPASARTPSGLTRSPVNTIRPPPRSRRRRKARLRVGGRLRPSTLASTTADVCPRSGIGQFPRSAGAFDHLGVERRLGVPSRPSGASLEGGPEEVRLRRRTVDRPGSPSMSRTRGGRRDGQRRGSGGRRTAGRRLVFGLNMPSSRPPRRGISAKA